MAYTLIAFNPNGRLLSKGRAETLGEAANWLTNAMLLTQVASVSVRRLRARAVRPREASDIEYEITPKEAGRVA